MPQRRGERPPPSFRGAHPSRAQLPFAKLTIPEKDVWLSEEKGVARDGSFDPTFPLLFLSADPPH